jgi:biopolymer transport protein ExbB
VGWLLLAAVAWFAAAAAMGPRAWAQPDGADGADGDADGAAGDAAAPGDGAATSGDDETALEWFFKALGWRYTIAFFVISFCLVALIVMNVLAARRDAVVPIDLVEGFEAHLNEKRYQEAYDMAKGDESFLGHVLAAGLAKLSVGYPQAIEAMQEVGEEETMKLEHRLSWVSLIGAVSPMVGLLGTVDGMCQAFIEIANTPITPDPQSLARKISTALVTTLVGLMLAIPAVVVYGWLRNRMQRLALEVGVLGEQLMSRFQKKA